MGFSITRTLVMLPLLTATVVRADVIAYGAVEFLNFVIVPSKGTITPVPPQNGSVFAQALDSTGGFSQDSNSETNSFASAFASTALAVGDSEVSNLYGNAFALGESRVTLPAFFNGFAAAEGQASGSASFELTGATGPVSATLMATIFSNQSLLTNNGGVAASSETIFTLTLPDIQTNPVLSFDSLLNIGPNQSLTQDICPTLNTCPVLTASVTLQPNTPYSYIVALDSETFGASVPEPASLALLATAAAGLAVVFRRRAHRI